MNEKYIEQKVIKKAKELGFLCYKFASPSQRGVPDRILISPKGKLTFVEFKSNKGKLTDLQENQIEKLRKAKQDVFVINNIDDGMRLVLNISD